MAPLSVLIIDDHPIVLAGLRMVLEIDPRFVICAEAASAAAAQEAAARLLPDLMIADLALAGGDDGIGLIRRLKAAAPDTRILVYSSSDEREYARHALAAGASGYVSKSAGLPRVADALARIAAGGIDVAPAIRRGPGDALSARELQVLDMIGEGHGLTVIAQRLGVTVKTVSTYRDRLKIKLGLDSARMLDRYAAARRTDVP